MRPSRILLPFLLAAGPGIPAAWAQDAFCLECHNDPELARETDSGRIVSLFVEPGAFGRSVHAGLTCAGCHDSVTEENHPGPVPDVGCGDCHADIEEEYSESLHARAPRPSGSGTPSLPPTCGDCHGIHDVSRSWDSESPTFRPKIPELCGKCHGDQKFVREAAGILSTRPFLAFQESVHGRAIARGRIQAAVCTDCHGTHSLFPPSDSRSMISRTRLPETCGKCHREVFAQFARSIHGKLAEGGHSEAPICTDCHGIHSILPHVDPDSSVAEQAIARTTCPQCHAGERLTREYGVPGRRVDSYLDSYHGLAQQLGSVVAANCASCHGVHEILPSDDPRSMIHPDNLPHTCGRCHPGAGENFARGPVHMIGDGGNDGPGGIGVDLVRAIYLPLILLTIGGMLAHNGLDFYRRLGHPGASWHREKQLPRWTRNQRLQHQLLLLSFVILVFSGFALKYPNAWWVELIRIQEGTRRLIHRTSGAVLAFLAAYHLGWALLARHGRGEIRAILPGLRDFREAYRQIGFNLGWLKSHPACGRYRYEEKLEYWALVWGTLVMVLTGGLLWFENISLQDLPKWALDVAAAVHLYEAWLATLAILVWHIYFVVFRPGVYPMNWTWLTGKIPESVCREEHREEWNEKFRQDPS